MFASEVIYGQLGRGNNPEEALNNLKAYIKVILPAETTEFIIRSVDMNFPTAKKRIRVFRMDEEHPRMGGWQRRPMRSGSLN